MIVIVMGLPGSGKSYFAILLAQKLNAKYLSSDGVRNALNMRGQYSLSEKLHVYEWLADLTEGALDEKESVVVDATFYLKSTRILFLDIAERRKINIKFIFIESSKSLIKQRLAKRRGESEANYLVYKKIRGEFEEMTIPCLHLNSSSENSDLMLESALKYIFPYSDGNI